MRINSATTLCVKIGHVQNGHVQNGGNNSLFSTFLTFVQHDDANNS